MEAALAGGASVEDVAGQFRVSARALAKHVATHGAATLPPATSTTDQAVPEETAPPTSRSEHLVSGRELAAPTTAREKAERIVDSLQNLLDRVLKDPKADLTTQLSVLRTMTGPLRLLGMLTGELGVSEATVAASPYYVRTRTAVVEALRPYPDALHAVIAALDQVERRGSSDLEAAAE